MRIKVGVFQRDHLGSYLQGWTREGGCGRYDCLLSILTWCQGNRRLTKNSFKIKVNISILPINLSVY